ncbi:MAG TPA: molybdopterin-converting factor chain 2 [Candidatus Omnitrophica bacterium]|nr:MAG: molybdopterin-converting factor chain 2 [Omnitrophica WOR_2 bacterium GWA2_45_18]HBR15874.1 molybdopterin-converting factor chain 2 [Candidatus Omnitrophota bacterium]
MFKLSSIPLEQIDLKEGLLSSDAGAFCSFEGWVRDHNEGKRVIGLEYEAYVILCEQEAEKILKEAREKLDILHVNCFHRVGRLNISEMAVWVGVTAAHRDAAFQACRYVIDEIKARLPVWKKEFYDNGDSDWVNCASCSSTPLSNRGIMK